MTQILLRVNAIGSVAEDLFLQLIEVILILLKLIERIGGGLDTRNASAALAKPGSGAFCLLGSGNAVLRPVDSDFFYVAEIFLASVYSVLKQIIDQRV